MSADRSIDAHASIDSVGADQFIVERLAHTVKTLKFEGIRPFDLSGHAAYGRHRISVVGSKLREHVVRGVQQLPLAQAM